MNSGIYCLKNNVNGTHIKNTHPLTCKCPFCKAKRGELVRGKYNA